MRTTHLLSCVTLLVLMVACSQLSSDWSAASEANTVETYQSFLEKHPESEYASEAKTRVESLEWQEAVQKNTVEAYQSFLEKHPENEYAGAAMARIESLEWQDTARENTVESYREFLLKHPESERSADAYERLGLLDDLAFEAARSANTTEEFEAYLDQFPGGRHESDALATIEQLRPIRGILMGLFVPGTGQMRFYLEVGDDLYDLSFSAASELVGDEDGSFQAGHLYDVIGSIGPRSFLTDAIGTIEVLRTVYVGEP